VRYSKVRTCESVVSGLALALVLGLGVSFGEKHGELHSMMTSPKNNQPSLLNPLTSLPLPLPIALAEDVCDKYMI
jgi:hypothetical protein